MATATILVFCTSTTGTLLFGTPEASSPSNTRLGLTLLVPALATTGATGFLLGTHSQDPRVLAKQRRMALIAAIGPLVLVPCVLYLATTVTVDHDGSLAFGLVQTLELVAGGTNIVLMSLNVRDGLRITGRLHPRGHRHHPGARS